MGLDNNQSTLVGSPILQAIPSPIINPPMVEVFVEFLIEIELNKNMKEKYI